MIIKKRSLCPKLVTTLFANIFPLDSSRLTSLFWRPGKHQINLLYGADLDEQNETYAGLHNFWSDDLINHFFKMAADGSLNRAQALVNDLCNRWEHSDPHLPVTGVITVPPGMELDLINLCK